MFRDVSLHKRVCSENLLSQAEALWEYKSQIAGQACQDPR